MVRALLRAALALVACGPAPPPARTEPPPAPVAVAEPRMVAITIDDLVVGGRDVGDDRVAELNRKIVAHLVAAGAPAVAFVNNAKLGEGPQRAARLEILRGWTAAGLELGNHTHTHPSLHDVSLADYEADVLRGEPEIRELNAERGMPLRWFRHPFLRTGATLAIRDAFHAFLADHGYSVAPVTINTNDWLYNFPYTDARTRDDLAAADRIGAEYMQTMAAVLTFHERATQQLLARPMRHVLLLHANELNAEYLDDLLALYRARGYAFVPLADALADDAYRLPDAYAGPAGVSWLFRWDFTRGHKQIDWSTEPAVPAFTQAAYEAAVRGD